MRARVIARVENSVGYAPARASGAIYALESTAACDILLDLGRHIGDPDDPIAAQPARGFHALP